MLAYDYMGLYAYNVLAVLKELVLKELLPLLN